MSFEVVTTTSLRFKEPLDESQEVTIVLSEGRWRNLRCVMRRWNNSKSVRLALVRSSWTAPVQQAADQIIDETARRAVPTALDEIEAWVGPVNPQLEVGLPAPRVLVMRRFTLDTRTIRLSGEIAEFKVWVP
jgi:hypothetical protein